MVGTFDPGVYAFSPPMFCRQSFATGSVRFQAGEVYDGADPSVAGNAQFFTADIPSVLGDMRDMHVVHDVHDVRASTADARDVHGGASTAGVPTARGGVAAPKAG